MAGLHAVIGGFGLLKQGASEIAFGFANLGTAGNIGMGALSSGIANVGRGFLLLGGVVAAVGVAAAVYLGVQAVRAAGDFQQGLNRLVTGAGDVTDNMGRMGQSILGISTSTGVLTGQLLPAMYQIISAGQRGAQAQDTLRVAAMGSVTEQAKIVDVAKALTTAMTDYGTSQFNATQFMNGYTRATQLSKGTLEQLSTSMGPILPLARNMGISFADVAGAMATMTNAGIPAERSATALRFLMQSLEVPTKKAKDAMTAMGLSSVDVGNEMKVSLPGALEMIYRAALRAGPEGSVPFNRAMSDMVGGQRSLQAMLALTGTHFTTFSADSRAVAAAMNGGKTAVLGWDTAQSNFNVKMDMARAAIAALGIVIGSQLLPFLSQIVGMVLPLIASFTQWVIQSHIIENSLHALVSALQTMIAIGGSVVAFFKNNELAMSGLKGVLITLAAIIAVAIVSALYAWAAAAWTAAAGMVALTWPILLVIAGVALLVAAFIHFYTTSAGFRSVVDAIVGVLKQVWAVIVQVAGIIVANFVPAMQRLWAICLQVWAVLLQGWAIVQQGIAWVGRLAATIGGILMPYLTMIGNLIASQFIPLWGQVVATWQRLLPIIAQLGGVLSMLGSTLSALWGAIQPVLATTVDLVGRFLLVSSAGKVVMGALIALAAIIGTVVVIALAVLVGVLTGITGALAMFLRGAIMAVAGVIQVFTGLVQILTGIVSLVVDLFTGRWGKLAADLGMIWQGILNVMQGIFWTIVGVVVATLGAVLSFVMGFVQGVIGFFEALYHSLVGGSIVPDMCNGIISAFTGMIANVLGLVIGFISNLIGQFVNLNVQAIAQIASLASSLASQFAGMVSNGIGQAGALVNGVAGQLNRLAGIAASAGSAMISALVGQINAGVGWVSGAINNVVAAIGNVLPHSPAKEGPLRDLNKFGPAITGGLASGIIGGIPEVRAAAGQMVAPIGASMSAGTTSRGSGSRSADNRPVIIQFSEREIVRALMPAVADEIRIHFGGR